MARTHSKKRKAAPKKPKTAPRSGRLLRPGRKAGARKRTKASKPAPAAAVGVGPHGESRKGGEPVPECGPSQRAAPSRTLRGTQPAPARSPCRRSRRSQPGLVCSQPAAARPDRSVHEPRIRTATDGSHQARLVQLLSEDRARVQAGRAHLGRRVRRPRRRQNAWVLVTEKSGLSLDKECDRGARWSPPWCSVRSSSPPTRPRSRTARRARLPRPAEPVGEGHEDGRIRLTPTSRKTSPNPHS